MIVALGSMAEAQTTAATVLAPNTFVTPAACEAARTLGNFRYYEPSYFGLKGRNPVNGTTKIRVLLEHDLCIDMEVVGGRKFVVQKEGTPFRANVLADGSLQLYARDDCGNGVFGTTLPAPPTPPLPVVVAPAAASPPVAAPAPTTNTNTNTLTVNIRQDVEREGRNTRPDAVAPAYFPTEKDRWCSGTACKLLLGGIGTAAVIGTVGYYNCWW